jgi:apolipoprotein N-acyltransferase
MTEPEVQTDNAPRALPPWWALAILSGMCVGFSQPVLIESLWGREVMDGSGLTGLLAFVGLVPAFVAIDGQGPKRAYAVGFVTFSVAFSMIVHWILTTVHVYGGLPLVVGLAVLLLLTSALAAYVAAAFAVTRVIVRFTGRPQWFVAPAALGAVELLRNFGPVGGFPWGSLGHSFATTPVFLQSAAVVGVTGLTIVAAAVNALLAEAVIGWRHRRRLPVAAVAGAVGIVVVMAALGGTRLARAADAAPGPTMRVALLQPNVNEGLADLSREPKESILTRFHDLQRRALADGADVIVWPEGSFPTRGLARDVQSFRSVKLVPPDLTPPQVSIVGASAVGTAPGPTGKRISVRHNSGFVVDGDLKVRGRFDKSHLVPFGEYVPWPFGGLVRQFIPLGTLTPGDTLEPIAVNVDGHELKVGITVCYEGVFPELARAWAKKGATVIANLTDDRWYGVSGMATQHLLMYALRAVESGRPILRATNTGISAWIDPYGAIHGATGMYVEALVVDDVPLLTIDTPYLAWGDWLATLCLFLVLPTWLATMVDGRRVVSHPHGATGIALGVIGGASVVGGVALALMSNALDEARGTQSMLLIVAGLLVGIGGLSGRVWGRRAALVVGTLAAVFAVVGVVVASSASALVVVVVGVVVAFVARKHQATRLPPSSSSLLSSSASAGS